METFEPGARVRAFFPFADHSSLATVLKHGEHIGDALGYMLELDNPLPAGWQPARIVWAPAVNVVELGAAQ